MQASLDKIGLKPGASEGRACLLMSGKGRGRLLSGIRRLFEGEGHRPGTML